MNENVVKFFELYDSDPELRAKVQAAEDAYPGSLEIREYVVEDVLIPIAEEMGLGFTLSLTVIGAVRELLGTGRIFSLPMFSDQYGMLIFVLAPGAFICLAYIMAAVQKLMKR